MVGVPNLSLKLVSIPFVMEKDMRGFIVYATLSPMGGRRHYSGLYSTWAVPPLSCQCDLYHIHTALKAHLSVVQWLLSNHMLVRI